MERLRGYPTRAVVVESTGAELESGNWHSKATPAAVVGSCLGWIAAGIPIVMAGNHERAGRFVARLLFTAARRRYQECRTLLLGCSNFNLENGSFELGEYEYENANPQSVA